ncbi:TPA: hypothetical protein ACS7Z1_003469 [Providencia alcalifaciens]
MLQPSNIKNHIIIDIPDYEDKKHENVSQTKVISVSNTCESTTSIMKSTSESGLTYIGNSVKGSNSKEVSYSDRISSVYSLNDYLDAIDYASSDAGKDVVIDIEQYEVLGEGKRNSIESNELSSVESLLHENIKIDIDEKIIKILNCKYTYQLDAIISEILPCEQDGADKVRQIMRMYGEQYNKVYQESGCFYRTYLSLHKFIESKLPYAMRSGGNISFHLLLQSLFFDGKYQNDNFSDTFIVSDDNLLNKSQGFLSTILPMSLSQVKIFGDLVSALLFHFPTIFYQYPKLIDEINQCIESHKITGSVIARFALCTASTLLAISPIISLGGAAQVGNIVRHIGRAVSYVDIPIVLVALCESWMQAYKYGSDVNDKEAQKFIAQESTIKTTHRILTQAMSLSSSLAGSIMRSLEKGSATEMLSLFVMNTLNLLLHQNPYEGVSISGNSLKRATYYYNQNELNIQTIGLLMDLSNVKNITLLLINPLDRLGYSINLPRSDAAIQIKILKEIVIACSYGERAILNENDKHKCLSLIESIYNNEFHEHDVNGLPEEFSYFILYLNELRKKDILFTSQGNEVNEKIIAVIMKVLAFRETVLTDTNVK